MPFTATELAEMAAADAEIEATFCLTQDEIALGKSLDLEALPPEIKKERERAKAYYLTHREKVIARSKKWYRENQARAAETQRLRYEKNREYFIQRQKEYTLENRKKLRDTQWRIKLFRKSMKMTQAELGNLIGVSGNTISKWERGDSPAKWDKLKAIFPGMDEP